MSANHCIQMFGKGGKLNWNERHQSVTQYCIVFAELQEAYVVTLKPGDVLFVPRHWWHYVENVGAAVSINSWIPLVIIVYMCIKNCMAQSFP